jgi:hypothetical protein
MEGEPVTTWELEVSTPPPVESTCEKCGNRAHLLRSGRCICPQCMSYNILRYITKVSCDCEDGTSASYKVGDVYTCFECIPYKNIEQENDCISCGDSPSIPFSQEFHLCMCCLDEYDTNALNDIELGN